MKSLITQTRKILLLLVFLFSQNNILAQYQITSSVIGGGGGNATGSSNTVVFTMGEPVIGIFSNSSHQTESGFWNVYKSGIITSVEDESILPTEFILEQNYPNPFNPSTVIGYQLPAIGNVTLKVYDILGSEVATLVDEYREAGIYEVIFDAGNLSSGVYLYRLQAGEQFLTKKMTLIK